MSSELFSVGTRCYVTIDAWDQFYQRCPEACDIVKPHPMNLAQIVGVAGTKFILKGIPHYYWDETELVIMEDGKTAELMKKIQ